MVFSVVYQANAGKKLREKIHGRNHWTPKFDAKHSTTMKGIYWITTFLKNNSLLTDRERECSKTLKQIVTSYIGKKD